MHDPERYGLPAAKGAKTNSSEAADGISPAHADGGQKARHST